MFEPVKLTIGDLMGRYFAALVPTTPAMLGFKERPLKQAIVWAPGRMVDYADQMLASWQRNALSAYFSFKNGVASDGVSTALVFGERAAQANPLAVVENDGFDKNGIRYRLAEGVENAHVAVLATCRYARDLAGQEQAVGMMAAMADNPLLHGGLLTLGEQPNYVMMHGFAVDARFVP